MKKILSVFLVFLLLVFSMATPVFAEVLFEGIGTSVICDDYTIEIGENNTCIISDYSGNAEKLTIPSEINGYKVVAIGDGAFENNITIKSLTLPDGLTKIGAYAFSHSKKLSSVSIPNSVTTIEEGAFFYCYNLFYVTIPKEVTFIGEKAFGYNHRIFDLDTMQYTYKVGRGFSIFTDENSTAAQYASDNNFILNDYGEPYDYATVVTFKLPYQWDNFETVYCHMWEAGPEGRHFTTWQSNKEICTVSGRTAQFDPDVFGGFDAGSVYYVIFSTDTGEQTYPAIFISICDCYELYTTDVYVRTPRDETPKLKTFWDSSVISDYEEAFKLYEGTTFFTKKEEPASPDEVTPTYALSYGDSNCDGSVNIKDATAIQKHLADIEPLSDTGVMLCSFIFKGQPINIRQATLIQRYCASIVTTPEIGKPAVTRIAVDRPDEWLLKDMTALSWNDAEEVVELPDLSQDVRKTSYAEFYVPIYNPHIAIVCGDYTTETATVDFFGGDQDGFNDYTCEWFSTDENGNIKFIWTTLI